MFGEITKTFDGLFEELEGLGESEPYIPSITEKYLSVSRWGVLNWLAIAGVIALGGYGVYRYTQR